MNKKQITDRIISFVRPAVDPIAFSPVGIAIASAYFTARLWSLKPAGKFVNFYRTPYKTYEKLRPPETRSKPERIYTKVIMLDGYDKLLVKAGELAKSEELKTLQTLKFLRKYKEYKNQQISAGIQPNRNEILSRIRAEKNAPITTNSKNLL